MRDYKELEVWQKARRLAVATYKATESFPRVEQFSLTAQTRRAAISVAANIAEGWGRGSTREYVQFLLVARGSLMELETLLIIAEDLAFLRPGESAKFAAEIRGTGQMLNRLIGALRNRGVPSREPWIASPDSRAPVATHRVPSPESRTP